LKYVIAAERIEDVEGAAHAGEDVAHVESETRRAPVVSVPAHRRRR